MAGNKDAQVSRPEACPVARRREASAEDVPLFQSNVAAILADRVGVIL